MLAQPSMIKRPVLDLGGKLLVGFKPEIYAEGSEAQGTRRESLAQFDDVVGRARGAGAPGTKSRSITALMTADGHRPGPRCPSGC